MRTAATIVALVVVLAAALSTAEAARPRIHLSYFDIRGRAEVVRMFLEYLQLPYQDHRFKTREEWQAIKDSGRFAFNQVPGLKYCPDRNSEKGCEDLVQTQSILRFLARKHDAYGDESLRHWVDMLTEGTEDFRSRLGKLVYAEDGPEKIEEHLKTTTPQWLGYFERLKARINDGKNTYFVGEKMTHGDIYFFTVLESHVRLGGLAILDDFPGLKAFWEAATNEPAIAAWRHSIRRKKLSNGSSASLDCASNPPPFDDFGNAWPAEESEL